MNNSVKTDLDPISPPIFQIDLTDWATSTLLRHQSTRMKKIIKNEKKIYAVVIFRCDGS